MAYKYDPEDTTFRPVAILETLHQENPKPSDFKAAFQKLILKIRLEEERLKQEYFEIARRVYNLPSIDEVKARAREIYKNQIFLERQAEINRMPNAIVHYTISSKQKEFFQNPQQEKSKLDIVNQHEEYSNVLHANVVKGIRKFTLEEIKDAQSRLSHEIQEQVGQASVQELLNALRPQDMSDIEKLTKEEIALGKTWQKWLKVFGDGNVIEREMESRYPEVLRTEDDHENGDHRPQDANNQNVTIQNIFMQEINNSNSTYLTNTNNEDDKQETVKQKETKNEEKSSAGNNNTSPEILALEEPIQFTRCVDKGLLYRYGDKYISVVSFPKILRFLYSENLEYSPSLFIGRILKRNKKPYTESTIIQNCRIV